MLPEYEMFLLLSLLFGFLMGFVGWGAWRVGARPIFGVLAAVRTDILWGLSALAVLAMGGFLTYALLGF